MNILVCDGNWLLHRAWNTMGKESSVPTERVPRAILDWFCTYAIRLQCSGGAVAFDGGSNFRYEVFPDYKLGRGSDLPRVSKGPMEGLTVHDAVYSCLKPTKSLLTSLGIRVIHLKRYEADDVLVSAGHKFGKPPNRVYLVVMDKDMMQAVNENVLIYRPEVNKIPEKIIGAKEVKTIKFGLSPKQFLDFQILMGDAMDNVPPVPAVEKKTAISIIKSHGSLSNFFKTPAGKDFYYARATEIHRNKELVMMSKKAFPYSLSELSFKNLSGQYDCKSFTALRDQQRKTSLF